MHKEIYKGRLITLNQETVDLPDNAQIELDIVRHPGGAVVIALDDDKQVCLIKQYRYAAGGVIWELPAGCIDPDDSDSLVTAKRELEEEAGLIAQHWQSLGSMFSTPGFCDEVLYIYLATGLSQTQTKRDEHELIEEIHWIPLQQALHMSAHNEIHDAKTVVGLFRAQAYLM